GSALFAVSENLAGVIAGRALIGFGVSACLMAAFKSYVLWFPADILSRVNGFQMAAGGLGALAATVPVEWALGITDWRGLFWILALLCIITALAVLFIVPGTDNRPAPEPVSTQIKGIIQVFKSPVFWKIAPLTTLSQAGYVSLQGLWAGPWLRDVAGLDRHSVATTLSLSAATMVFGFIFLGSLSERLARRGIPVRTSAVTGMALLILVQMLITFHAPVPTLLLMGFFGFFGTSGILSYTALTLEFPSHLSGRVTTSINMLVFLAVFAVQWAIGGILNQWEPVGPGRYHPQGYCTAFLMVTALQCAGLIWFLVFKRKAA
ncbi:MAG: MFS transporter, partial [Desulfobacterales bacterium]|nr:MFS transporter [Desulfobacterales bacterium]